MNRRELNESLKLIWICWVVYALSSCVGFIDFCVFRWCWMVFVVSLNLCCHVEGSYSKGFDALQVSCVFLISTFFWFVMCLHEWLMWPLVYMRRHAPHVRLRQSCRIFKWMSWVEVGQEDRVSGGKSSCGVDVVPMWRICHVVVESLSWNFGCAMEVCRRCCSVEARGGYSGPAQNSFPLLSFPQSAL